jgi:hypothetical protein
MASGKASFDGKRIIERAIALTSGKDDDEKEKVIAKLTIDERLRALFEVARHGDDSPYDLEANDLFDFANVPLLGKLRGEGRAWAAAIADEIAKHERVPEDVRWPVFLTLVRAKIPIEPRWDSLLPLGFGVYRKLTDECVRAIPEGRRDAAIVRAIGRLYVGEIGLPLLAQHPSVSLTLKILEAMNDDRLLAKSGETFRGFLEICELASPEGEPKYDAYLYMVDSGTIFAHGTTKVVADIIQSGIECSDAALDMGIEAALEGRKAKRTKSKSKKKTRR